jgi:hypothetical protein
MSRNSTRTQAAQSSTTDKATGAAQNTSTNTGADLAKEMGVELAVDAALRADAEELAAFRAAAAEAAAAAARGQRGPDIFVREHTPDVDTGEQDLSIHDRSIDLANDFDIYQLRDQLNSGAVDLGNPLMKNFVETLQFMEEDVLVRVHPSSEKDAEKIIETWNDGTPQRFIRGQWVVAKRKYVEVLARSMPFSVTTPESLDGRGDKTRRIERHAGNRFPFEMKDRNPLGMAWLNRLFLEG